MPYWLWGPLDEAKSLGDRIPDWASPQWPTLCFAEAVLKRDGKDAMSVARPSLEVATNLPRQTEWIKNGIAPTS